MALTSKQQVWIEEYFSTWNATEAARRAGYAHPNVEGPANLVKPSIAIAIRARIAEKTMTADEALVRLAEQARAEYSAYIMSDGSVDLEAMKRDGKMHLVKKVKPTKFGLEVEFYDAQTALVNIGRHHKLFTDGLDLGGEVKFSESESAAERITSRLDSIVTRIRAQSSPSGTSTDTTGSSST